MKEIWKTITHFPNYQVSSFGRIKSYHFTPPRLLNIYFRPDNVGMVCLCHLKQHRMTTIHRIVAEAFLENPSTKLEINHLDANRRNNHVSNLEYSTRKENSTHAKRLGLYRRGEQCHSAKLTSKDVLEIRRLASLGIKRKIIRERFGIHLVTLCNILVGKRWGWLTHGQPVQMLRLHCTHCPHTWNPQLERVNQKRNRCPRCHVHMSPISSFGPPLKSL